MTTLGQTTPSGLDRPDDEAPITDSAAADVAGGSPAALRRWARHIWWIAGIVGAASFAFIWLATPHGRAVDSYWEFVAKFFAYGCVCTAIALFPWASRSGSYLIVYVPFLFFTGYLIPRISGFYYVDVTRAHGDNFYTHVYLLLYPGIVLTVTAAYRLGGGSPGRCLKIGVTGMILIFSGFLDVMWMVVNPVPIPKEIDAPHINMFTGGPIPFWAAILFAVAHIPILIVLNLLPLDRWIDRFGLARIPSA